MSGRACALALALALVGSACVQVAPVHRGGTPKGPMTWTYAGHHGRPLAYRGDVCEVAGRHRHEYPPSPRAAFVETPDGWRDTRPTYPYFGQHPLRGRTCFREGWHLHLEPPDAELVFDDSKNAWRRP